VPPGGQEDEITGGTILTPEGETALGHLFEPTVDAPAEVPGPGSSGCAAGPASAGWLLLLLLALGILIRTRYCARLTSF